MLGGGLELLQHSLDGFFLSIFTNMHQWSCPGKVVSFYYFCSFFPNATQGHHWALKFSPARLPHTRTVGIEPMRQRWDSHCIKGSHRNSYKAAMPMRESQWWKLPLLGKPEEAPVVLRGQRFLLCGTGKLYAKLQPHIWRWSNEHKQETQIYVISNCGNYYVTESVKDIHSNYTKLIVEM